MKIAVVFLLVAAISSSGLFDLLGAASYNCVNNFLKKSEKLMANFMTHKYSKGQGQLTDDRWENAFNNLKKNVKTSGCTYSSIMEYVLSPNSSIVSEVIKAIRPYLLSNMFTPSCLSYLLLGGLPQLIIDLNRNVCHKSDSELTVEDLRKPVKITSCILNGGNMNDFEHIEVAKPIHYIFLKAICVIAKYLDPVMYFTTTSAGSLFQASTTLSVKYIASDMTN